MKRQFQKLTNFPFFLSFTCLLTLFLMFSLLSPKTTEY